MKWRLSTWAQVLDAERRRHGQVDRLAARLGQGVEHRRCKSTRSASGTPRRARPSITGPGRSAPADAVALEQAAPLERRDRTRNRALGKAATLCKLADARGAVALHDRTRSCAARSIDWVPVDCIKAPSYETSFHIQDHRERRRMSRQQDAAVRDPLRGGDGHPRPRAGAGSCPRSEWSSSCPRRSRCSPPRGRRRRMRTVWLDPDFVMEQVGEGAAASSTSRPATPSTACTSAATAWRSGRSTARRSCATVTCAARRRWPTSRTSCRLSQAFPQLDSAGGTICEPNDRPLDSRHLDMVFALQTLSDKPYMGSVTSGPNAADTIAMSEILLGGREAIERTPAVDLADQRELAASLRRPHAGAPCSSTARADQAVMHHAVPAHGRDVAGVRSPRRSCSRWPRRWPGSRWPSSCGPAARSSSARSSRTPTCSRARRASARPSRRSACSAPARSRASFGLPWRSGGGLTSSQTVDAQAAYEALMTMLPTFLAGANYVMHSAGLARVGARVSCYEKFIVDIEILRMLQEEFTPLEIDEASLAFDAHQEVGQGGHFLGAAHTLERFRDCFYRPLLSSTENFERWKPKGGARRDRRGPARSGGRRSRSTSSRRSTTAIRGRAERVRRHAAGASSATDGTERSWQTGWPSYERLGTETRVRGAGAGEGARGDRGGTSSTSRSASPTSTPRRTSSRRACARSARATPTTARRRAFPSCARRLPSTSPGTRGVAVDPARVLVAPGAKWFLFFGVLAVAGEGDEVIYPNPGYPIYESAINWSGATRGAASDHRGERTSRSRRTTWPSGSRRGRGW